MKIAIMGMARSGKSALQLALRLGHEVIAINQGDPSLWSSEITAQENLTFLSQQECKESLIASDLIIKSPGIDPRIELFEGVDSKKIISEVEFGFSQMQRKPKIIAITGSNGKTTTVTMISQYLEMIGETHFLCGNVGTPLCDYLNEGRNDNYLVVELSSFQLENMPSFQADIGAILNIYPNHQERYDSFEAYKNAKENLKAKEMIREIQSIEFPLRVLGSHNQENANFAYEILKRLSIDVTQFEKFCTQFNGVEHRMEFVGEIKGNQYYNDSKSTNFIALNAAISDLADKKNILILTGRPRGGEDFSSLDFSKIEQVYIYGEAAKLKLPKEFISKKELSEIIEEVDERYQNYKIIFSPGFPSFDLYENFEKRGEAYKKIVKQL